MEYIDLALVKLPTGKTGVYQAPEFSCLEKDDEVLVKEFDGVLICGQIIDVIAIHKQSDELRFINEICEVKEPPRIVSKVTYKQFDYKEGGDAHDD